MVKRFLLGLLLLVSSVWAQAQNVPPTISFMASPSEGMAPATFYLMASTSDSDGSVAKVDFYNGTTLIGTATRNGNPCGQYCTSWNNVPAGTYNLTAVATDNLGATTTSGISTVTVRTNAPPTASLAATPTTAAAPATIVLTASASDSDGSVAKLSFLNGTNVLATLSKPPYTFTWANVPAGTYSITVDVSDDRGASTISAPVVVTVTAPNAAPTITLGANPASTTAPGNVTLSANASDTDGTIAKVEFFHGTTLLATLTQPPFAYQWPNLAAGTYTVTAKVTDNGGAVTTSAPVMVTVAQGTVQQAYYIHADHLNTPRLITDEVGRKVWEWHNMDPFGGNAADEDPQNSGTKLTFNLRFPGQYFDKETNLHYNYFRTYDPATGRYIESDPIGLNGGINTYGYVGGNPVAYTDPLGLQAMARASRAAMGTPGSLSPTGMAAARAVDKAAADAAQNLPSTLCRMFPMACAAAVASQAAQDFCANITADDLRDKTPDEIEDLAQDQGYVRDPKKPNKWRDPVTGDERIRIDPGHIDPKTGRPYNNPRAAVPHVHGYDQNGRKIGDPTTPNNDPHFPLR